MNCLKCRFWEPFGFTADEEVPSVGTCHRYPGVAHPRRLDDDSCDYNWAHWPITEPDGWCGEFQEDNV